MLLAEEEKVLKVFSEIHGVVSGSCTARVSYDDLMNITGVDVYKNGQIVWGATIQELAFDYATKDLK